MDTKTLHGSWLSRARTLSLAAACILAAVGVGLGARVVTDMLAGDCCAPGAACCFPGSPCCAHAHVADAR